jgi:excinuclease ABC subunit C
MIRQDFDKLNIPDVPGVYEWRDDTGTILYIGKATSLRDRVRSYFAPDVIKTRGAHIVDMVFKASTITYHETMNAFEALILEANLIKKHQPYYNTKEKDDKSFNCVVITREAFPQLFLVRQKDIDTKTKTVRVPRSTQTVAYDAVYGPYPSGGAIREALKLLRKIFPFRDIASSKKDNAMFYRQIGLAPDTSSTEAGKRYKETITRLKLILGGKLRTLIVQLTRDMMRAAKAERFEEAQELKGKVFALEHIQDISLIKRDLVSSEGGFRIEAYDIAHLSGTQMVGVMTVVEDAVARKSDYRKFIVRGFDKANDAGALREVLTRRLAHTEWRYPDAIVVDGNIIQINVAREVLAAAQLEIPIIAVTKDDRHKAKALVGDTTLINENKYAILLANSEAHRFAVTFHKDRRRKAML